MDHERFGETQLMRDPRPEERANEAAQQVGPDDGVPDAVRLGLEAYFGAILTFVRNTFSGSNFALSSRSRA